MKELPEICRISYNNRPKGMRKRDLIYEWWHAGMITPSNKYEIAEKLGISRTTFIEHLQKLYLNNMIGEYTITSEERGKIQSKSAFKLDPLLRIERSKKARSHLTFEIRSAASKKAHQTVWANRTPEEKSSHFKGVSKSLWNKLDALSRKERAKKRWETSRKNIQSKCANFHQAND